MADINENENANKKPDKEKMVMRAVLVALVLVIVAGAGYILLGRKDSAQTVTENQVSNQTVGQGSGGSVVITEDNRGSAGSIAQRIAEGMIVVKMTGEWTFQDGNSAGDGYVGNSQHNSAPLKITVTLGDTGEVLLETDPIPVGSCIENFKLAKVLEKGTYSAVVAHSAVDEEGNVTNTVRTAITINVLN